MLGPCRDQPLSPGSDPRRLCPPTNGDERAPCQIRPRLVAAAHRKYQPTRADAVAGRCPPEAGGAVSAERRHSLMAAVVGGRRERPLASPRSSDHQDQLGGYLVNALLILTCQVLGSNKRGVTRCLTRSHVAGTNGNMQPEPTGRNRTGGLAFGLVRTTSRKPRRRCIDRSPLE
jgi:hypothetical protein